MAVLAAAVLRAPAASASAQAFCGELGGDWDGRYCHTAVQSERKATRDIKMAVPGDLVDNPTTGPVIREYLRDLMNNWRTKGASMVQDSWGEENYQVFTHGRALSVAVHEDYHADGPNFSNAYRTFTFDMAGGKRLQLADITKAGTDPLTAIPPLAEPFVRQALDRAAWQHSPGTYPFTVDRWTPDKVFSGGYKAWALTPDELILYMPDYPVGHDSPVQYGQIEQWSMDGGTVEPHIPLSALGTVLRPEFGGT
ncbi:mannan-binding family protein [Mycobacterium sp. 663a-19]|uniref:mannan-binding family protein n=1 Tax=Mycobacterium sp. 663a-19 TaxID=2986148 RepID=UPI002D1ECC60|nr:mannan-binding family protein [Mycobacterium sp. 663a-19]MEB3983147.1 mannan-binding family protein [Mycobacterium sp. 663a-19]